MYIFDFYFHWFLPSGSDYDAPDATLLCFSCKLSGGCLKNMRLHLYFFLKTDKHIMSNKNLFFQNLTFVSLHPWSQRKNNKVTA